MPGLVT